MEDVYLYKATVRKVVDGDTIDFYVDLGFYMEASLRFRLLGIDAPETRGGTPESKKLAREATEYVRNKLAFETKEVYVRTYKADSFGRWLAEVLYTEEKGGELKSLGDDLVAKGYAIVVDK